MAIVYIPMSLRHLSHELRTPLTGILGNAELLKDEKLSAWQKNCVLEILQAGDTLLKLANQLLEAKSINSEERLNITFYDKAQKN